jgi:hypothetical protein
MQLLKNRQWGFLWGDVFSREPRPVMPVTTRAVTVRLQFRTET